MTLYETLTRNAKDIRGRAARFSILHRGDIQIPENNYFGILDAACLYGMIRAYRPVHYIEVGSGYSTLVAHQAAQDGNIPMEMISIDPHPRLDIDSLCNFTYRQDLRRSDTSWIVSRLLTGDILFTDGSHQAEYGSDVTLLWTEVIPYLHPGVLVHVHDVFLPEPYPLRWANRHYSEQYVLAAALALAPEKFEILIANGYAATLKDKGWDERHGVGKSFWFAMKG